jgi:LmbE family N-acetylglucosaminyl deacetylase
MKRTTDISPLLAFGAHPDDIEFGCGGIIAREASLGRPVHFVVCSRGEHFEVRATHAIKLAAVIRRIRPGVVLVPSVVENQHPDHAKLGRLVRDATRLARYGGLKELRRTPPHAAGQLFFYAVTPDAEPTDLGRVLVDVSAPGLVAQWTAAMEAHVSQMRTRNYVEFQLARARVHGLRAGVDYAIPLFPNDPPVVDSLGTLERAARRF